MAEYNKDGLGNIFFIAVAVCLVCSIIVSGAAVALKPMQVKNKELDQKQNILRAAGLLPADSTVDASGRGVEEIFSEFTPRVVDLVAGQFADDMDATAIDPLRVAKDPAASRELSGDEDIATIGRRENLSVVYIKEAEDGSLEKLVLPVRGYGLWGTLFGYLALDGDLETISGLGFYDHKETPGLGGEVDNPRWKSGWVGVRLYNDSQEASVALIKSRSAEGSAAAEHEVDALSGATFTTRGVQNLVNFWTGQDGFGPFIKNLRAGA